MQQDIWRPIENYNDYYSISNLGKVRSESRWRNSGGGGYIQSDKILKANKVGNGYWAVGLHRKGKVQMNYIHRLIANGFIPNPLKKMEVNHIDGNITNNNIANLEWVTREENMQHAYRTGLKKPLCLSRSDHGKAKKVIDLKTGLFWGCIKDASEDLNIGYDQLKSMLNGGQKNKTTIRYL